MPNTLKVFADELARMIGPLRAAVKDDASFAAFMRRIGWDLTSLPEEYGDLTESATEVVDAVAALGDEPTASEAVAALAAARDFVTALRAISYSPPGLTVEEAETFALESAQAILELLLLDHLSRRAPRIYRGLLMLGVLTFTPQAAAGNRPAHMRATFDFAAMVAPLDDPMIIAELRYGWRTESFEFRRVADDLLELFDAIGLVPRLLRTDRERQAGYQTEGDSVERMMELMLVVPAFETIIGGEGVEVGVSLMGYPAQGTDLPGVVVEPFIPSAVGLDPLTIADGLTVKVRAGTNLAETLGLILTPEGLTVRFPFAPGTLTPAAGFGATLTYDPSAPTAILGSATGTRLEVDGFDASFAFDLVGTAGEVKVTLAPRGLALVLAATDPDSFLHDLLGGETRIDLPLGVAWSSRTGLSFVGANGFKISLDPHLELGPVMLDHVDVAVIADASPARLSLRVASDFHGTLGPVSFTVRRLGIALRITFEDGNFGPFDLSVGFLPPTGAGIKVDSDAVTGGGFIAYDDASGRYSGALQLVFEEIAVNALAILDTRPPEGEGDWSFVGVISAEFEPIQLGLGFTLNGVGGLIGLNRRVDRGALEGALAEGGLANLFFPTDVVAQANQLLGAMSAYFPAAEGRYVFGPAAKLGWLGLVKGDIAILIEVPEPVRVVILGHVNAVLPSETKQLIKIAADVLGFLEFEEHRFELRANLGPDSRVIEFKLEGELALRVDWGERPDFILSIGGFHPDYKPPAGFRVPKRLKIPIGSGEDPRLDLTGFLALTSNTAQVGAKVDFYASAGWGLSVDGDVGFEALFIFAPFSFRARFYGHVSLKRNGGNIATVTIEATLTGPKPWHAWGEACLVIDWLPDICVGFEVTLGGADEEIPEGRDATEDLRLAIGEAKYWSEGATTKVIKAAPAVDAEDATTFEPSASVTLRQNVVPLNRVVEKYGGGLIPGGPKRYDLGSVTVGAAATTVSPETAFFAAYQYEELTENERLSRESFEKMEAGFSIARGGTSGDVLSRDLAYETKIVENLWDTRPQDLHVIGIDSQLAGVRVGAASIAPLRTSGPKRFTPSPGTPPLVDLAEEGYIIVSVNTFADSNLIPPMTRGLALQALDAHMAANPLARGTLQVVPAYELAEAA